MVTQAYQASTQEAEFEARLERIMNSSLAWAAGWISEKLITMSDSKIKQQIQVYKGKDWET